MTIAQTYVAADLRTSSALRQTWANNWLMQKLVDIDALTIARKGRVALLDLTLPGADLLRRLEYVSPACTRGIEPGFYVVECADDVRDVTWTRVEGDVRECLGAMD